jgi:hypothetical protein
VGENPCNVISKKLIVSANTVIQLSFLKGPGAPVHKDDDVQQSVNARRAEDPPVSLDFARDAATPKRPPQRLEGAPPSEDRVHEHRECPIAF